MLLISGLSGAGKSTVLHALEDAGFFCTDNLPLEMLREWSMIMHTRKRPAAVCLDARSGFTANAICATVKETLAEYEWQLIFVEAEDNVLQRRFSTVKRRHPFPIGEDLMDSIRKERESLLPIRNVADLVLDSSHLTPYELAENAELFWHKPESKSHRMNCTVMSFSYKHGLPAVADMVFDMRFLPNPHYVPELAQQTGRDAEVIEFLESCSEVMEAQERIRQWFAYSWPMILKERKQYFTVAFGCSGGRHRSVYMAEKLADWLNGEGLALPVIQHRELGIVERRHAEKTGVVS